MNDTPETKPKIDKRFFIILFAITATVILFFVVSSNYDLQDIGFNSEPVLLWNDNWNYKTPNGAIEKINLPEKIKTYKNRTVVITKIIPDYINCENTLCIRSSIQSVKAYVDNNVIYEYGTDKTRYPGENAGSAWVIFRIPPNSKGKELKLEITSSTLSDEFEINEIYLSSKSSILFYIIHTYGFNFFIAMLITILGIIMIILHFFTNTQFVRDYSLVYLSLFSVLVSVWILGESKILQFFTGNQFLVSKLAFFSFYLFPLPLTLYIDTSYQRHHFRFAHWFFRAFFANFVICSILGISGKFAFVDMVIPCHILIIAFFISTIASLFYEYYKFDNKEALKIMVGIFILSIFGIMEFHSFYFQSTLMVSKYLSIGLLFFVFYQQSITMAKIYRINKKGIQSEYYEWLAYIDPLTHGNNRTAFIRDIKNFFEKDKNCWLFIFDLNDLKYINDNLGHHEGDNAIKLVYNIISHTFAPNGTAYRMGGDEFACILQNSSETEAVRLSKKFFENIEKESKKLNYSLNAPMGFEKYISSKWENFDEFFSYVDNKMYENKRHIKSKDKIIY